MERLTKILNSNWAVTIISTMIGIIVGLYITNYFEEHSLLNAKEKALEQVALELADNGQLLRSYHDTLKVKYEALTYLFDFINDDLALVMHEDSLERFRATTASIFIFSSFDQHPHQQARVRGDLDLEIESDLVVRDLSHIVWDSYKQTEYMSVTDFNCLTDVEAIYHLQSEVNEINAQWMDIFFEGGFMGSSEVRMDFMSLWEQLLLRQKLLLQVYEFKGDVLEVCG